MRDHTSKQVITIQLGTNHGLKWSSFLLSPYQVWVKGHVFKGRELFSGASLAQLFVESFTLKDSMPCGTSLKIILRELNGFFAVVIRGGGRLFVSVDRVRSIPLFYSVDPRRFILSDEAEWVRQQVDDQKLDPIACEEFQVTGYVTGNDTLYPSVKQLQAGELLAVQSMPKESISLQKHRYYRFQHAEPEQYDENRLRSELNTAAVGAIQRLIDYAQGRQIVIPLSGGYDSRLIATLLCHLGYENIIAFSYGKPGNTESAYSRLVAKSLGIPWIFVEYSATKWRNTWDTMERKAYQRYASGWTSLPHVQDWLAVRELKKHAKIANDCIFVPGHTGDFISGGHIPDDAFSMAAANINTNTLVEAIINKHYCIAPTEAVTPGSWEEMKSKIQNTVNYRQISSAIAYADAFEEWEWQERQAKYIVNSIRVYEFFGYEWWLPLWDAEFMEFWEDVPLKLRQHQTWYQRYVSGVFARETKNVTEIVLDNASKRSTPLAILKLVMRNMGLLESAKTIRNVLEGIGLSTIDNIFRQSHFLLNGYPPHLVRQLRMKGYSVLGIHAALWLVEIDNRENIDNL